MIVSHGQKAVDPLKLRDVPRAEPRRLVSHGQKAVDPLKPRRRPAAAAPAGSVSHGQKAVDPLKPKSLARRGRVFLGSPTVRRPWTH